jgi:hypothetical protein
MDFAGDAYLELLTLHLFRVNGENLKKMIFRRNDYRQGFRLEIVFIEQFNTQLVIRNNYSVIDDFHNLQITRAQTNVLSLLHYPLIVS